MKKLIVLFVLLLFSEPAFAVENPWDVKLPFKQGSISYSLKGMMKGEKTIYVKDYGRTTAEYQTTEMKMMGISQQNKEIIITTPEWAYHIDLSKGTGTKQANPKKYFIEEFSRLSKGDQKKVVRNAETLGYSTVEGMGGHIEKNATKILGYQCDKANMMGTTVYTISGTNLPLKTEGNTMGIKISETATNIDRGAPPADKFRVPANIKITHNTQSDQMMQTQAQTVIHNLVEGKQPPTVMGSAQTQSHQKGNNTLSPDAQNQMEQLMKLFNKE